jgi:hypothetical protein
MTTSTKAAMKKEVVMSNEKLIAIKTIRVTYGTRASQHESSL